MKIGLIPQENSIERRLLTWLLLIAACLTLCFSAFQIWLSYQEQLETIQNILQQIEQVQMQGIATAVWNYSFPELDAQIAGLTHFPYINYAAVENKGEILTASGIKKDSNVDIHTFDIYYKYKEQDEFIGVLSVQVDKGAIITNLSQQITRIMIFQALNILIILMIFLLLMNRQVTRHLITAAQYFQTLDINKFDIPLKLDKKPSNDELDTMVGAFNQLQQNLILASELRYESERKHATLLANLPGMAFRCQTDRAWTMELVSAGCQDLTGYLPEELIHNQMISYNEIIHPDDRQYVWEIIQKDLSEKNVYELTYRIQCKDEQTKWVWEKGVSIVNRGSDANMIEGFVIDITERKQQERELEAIATISYALRSAQTKAEMLPVILEQTTHLLSADGGTLELIDANSGDSIIMLASGEYEKMLGERIPVDQGLNSYIRKTGKPYLNNQVASDPLNPHPEIALTCPAAAGVPMVANKEWIGFLWFGRKGVITVNALRTLAAIADIAANAIHRANLFHQTEQRLQRLIGLQKIDSAINNNQDLSFTFNVVLEQAIHLLNVDAGHILLIDRGSDIYNYRVGQGFYTQCFNQIPVRIGENCADQAFLNQVVVKNHDIRENPLPPQCQKKMEMEGFLSFAAAPLVIKNEVEGLLQVFCRKPIDPAPDWVEYLETLAGQAAIATGEAYLLRDLHHSNRELRQAYDQTIEGWSTALDLRDKETEGHSQRVCALTVKLAEILGIHGEELVNIRRGALLHDIGKMGVPDHILLKPGPLTGEEWQIMYKHPIHAYQLLSPIEYLKPALEIPYCHHEKWDGSGYPRGLKEYEIPLAARIFAVVDVWDALTSTRPYRDAMPETEVMDYISRQSGKHFDPEIVRLFFEVMQSDT